MATEPTLSCEDETLHTEISDADVLAAISTFPNGCDFALHFAADGTVRLAYGCYGIHWNLAQGARYRVSRWLGFSSAPKVVSLAPETILALKERQPCARCGGFTYELKKEAET